jgi:hypothetical protein
MHRFRRGLPLGRRVVGLRQADGMPPEPQRARSVDPTVSLGGLAKKHLIKNQVLCERTNNTGSSP